MKCTQRILLAIVAGMLASCVIAHSPGDKGGRQELSTREFLKLFLYEPKNVDDFLSGTSYSFAKYDPEVGMLHRSRSYFEGIDDSFCIYNYGKYDVRRTITHADRPCRINVYGSSFAMGEQVSDGETWEEVLASHLGEPIRNFGVGGFSTYVEYLRMLKEEKRTPAKYLIFNMSLGDHGLNLVPWLRVRFRAETDKAFHTTMPYVKVNPATGGFKMLSNPCPTPESLYNLCDLDWVYDTFKNDYLVKMLLQNDKVQQRAREMIKNSRKLGIDGYYDEGHVFQKELVDIYLDPAFNEAGQYGSMRVVVGIEKYAATNDKKVLYVISYGPIDIKKWINNRKRLDQQFIDFMQRRGLPYIDMMEEHAKDYKNFNISIEDYLSRYFIHHSYSPVGTQFQAFSIKDELVDMLEPKPIAYQE